MRKRKRARFLLAAALVIVMSNFLLNQNVTQTRHRISSPRIPKEFDGFVIVQISDLHSASNKGFCNRILEKVESLRPDLIVLTGDLVDSAVYAKEAALIDKGRQEGYPGQATAEFTRALTGMAPVYYVYGNHEMILLDDPKNNFFKVSLEEMGVRIANNEVFLLQEGDAAIQLAGIQDPATLYKDPVLADSVSNTRERTRAMLEHLAADIDLRIFTILVAHRPEYIDLYADSAIDLVLAGHAHGGQVRLPFMREGLYAPNQGFLPHYTNGLYRKGPTAMVVSRGLGNSVFPLRILNRPELAIIELTNIPSDDIL